MVFRVYILVISIYLCSANLKTVHDYAVNRELARNNSVKENGPSKEKAVDAQTANRPMYNGKPRVRWIIIYVVAAIGGVTLGIFLTISIYVRLGPHFFQSLQENTRSTFLRSFDVIRSFFQRSLPLGSSEDNLKKKRKYRQLHEEECFEEDDTLGEDVPLQMDTSQNSDVAQSAQP